ncbi:Ribonuclease H [Abeliophyllum distichum]|uniref:Ribonuclease H n=1 Tax=Abeliophyllum distichum TaxID=126358 RepID=A0ABD1QZE8_9LAMI
MKTKGKDILKKPAPMRASSSELNQRRYCRYHRSTRHDTDDCRDLKGEIESLIRRGHLEEFLARPPGGGEPPQPQGRIELSPPPQPRQGEIHMIVGGSQYLEGSRRQRQLSNEMDIDARHVRPFPKPLQGFTGDYVNSKGQIALVVELGLPLCNRRIIADFVIVDLPSNYNAILGRPILNELKAAASIYHYAIKFSTPHGVGVVRGSQLVARICNINFPRVGVDTLRLDTEFPARKSVDELDEDTVEDLGSP